MVFWATIHAIGIILPAVLFLAWAIVGAAEPEHTSLARKRQKFRQDQTPQANKERSKVHSSDLGITSARLPPPLLYFHNSTDTLHVKHDIIRTLC